MWTEHFDDFKAYFNENFIQRRIENLEWFEEFWRGKMVHNLITHYFTSISFMKEVCNQNYPSNSTSLRFVEACALAHFNKMREYHGHMPNPSYLVDYLKECYWTFDDFCRNASGVVLCLGMVLNLLQIGFK